jgi:hypothetical protein
MFKTEKGMKKMRTRPFVEDSERQWTLDQSGQVRACAVLWLVLFKSGW